MLLDSGILTLREQNHFWVFGWEDPHLQHRDGSKGVTPWHSWKIRPFNSLQVKFKEIRTSSTSSKCQEFRCKLQRFTGLQFFVVSSKSVRLHAIFSLSLFSFRFGKNLDPPFTLGQLRRNGGRFGQIASIILYINKRLWKTSSFPESWYAQNHINSVKS